MAQYCCGEPAMCIPVRWIGKFIGRGGVFATMIRSHGVSYHVERDDTQNTGFIYVNGANKERVMGILFEHVKRIEADEKGFVESNVSYGHASPSPASPSPSSSPDEKKNVTSLNQADFPALVPMKFKDQGSWGKGVVDPRDEEINHLRGQLAALDDLKRDPVDTIIVRNCPVRCHGTEVALTEKNFLCVFRVFGDVVKINIITTPEAPDTCICLVQYAEIRQASYAALMLFQTKMEQRPIDVRFYRPLSV